MFRKVLAAFVFFTRLPLGRFSRNLSADDFRHVVEFWPLVGWLTGGVMALTFWLASCFFPMTVAAVLALLSRVLLTGALHEDGLADCCDGFGANVSRERRLQIMKDSHVGSYGVLGLLFYFAIMIGLLSHFSVKVGCILLLAGDAWSKFCAAQIITFLPYVRKPEEAKSGIIYVKTTMPSQLRSLFFALVPLILAWKELPFTYQLLVAPGLVLWLSIICLQKKLGGYTGDCCGAVFLCCELSFYLGAFGLLFFAM